MLFVPTRYAIMFNILLSAMSSSLIVHPILWFDRACIHNVTYPVSSHLVVETHLKTAQGVNQLRHQRGLALLFVTHNIALARHIATQVAALNQGEIVDHGPVNDVLDNPSHSYTRHLLDDLPQL